MKKIDVALYVKELSDSLSNNKKIEELKYYPIDRFYIEKHNYLQKILSVSYLEFLFYNFEKVNSTYSVQLFVCLPELWEKITYSDILNLIGSFTNSFSFYTLIEYTYKYLNIDLLDEIFYNDNVGVKFKQDCANYFYNIGATFYMDDHDYRMLKDDFFGINLIQIESLQNKFQKDNQFKATGNKEELKEKLLKFKNMF
ncbi:hypothetical protein [Chryseobacterium sp. Mn2064]|uniref:hypothetical protein n=1 Tax=Chryseobacterium sp. Mn2064 TaxID=3395263 RepID=UPI003BCE8DD3